MPQLDSITFITQLSWLIIIFLAFYGIVLSKSLPALARIIKTRKLKLSFGQSNLTNLDLETTNSINNYENSLINSLSKSRTLLSDNIETSNLFISHSISDLNKGSLNEANTSYVLILGKTIGKQFALKNLY
jgi:F-type H+-transporting ATPase subunit b